eukprot:361777-Chlamydomonas_euryale.AAC.2
MLALVAGGTGGSTKSVESPAQQGSGRAPNCCSRMGRRRHRRLSNAQGRRRITAGGERIRGTGRDRTWHERHPLEERDRERGEGRAEGATVTRTQTRARCATSPADRLALPLSTSATSQRTAPRARPTLNTTPFPCTGTVPAAQKCTSKSMTEKAAAHEVCPTN